MHARFNVREYPKAVKISIDRMLVQMHIFVKVTVSKDVKWIEIAFYTSLIATCSLGRKSNFLLSHRAEINSIPADYHSHDSSSSSMLKC